MEIDVFRNALIDIKDRGIKPRYVTTITKHNLRYCKEAMKIGELRHLDGIKGNFYVNETEYLVPASFHDKGKPAEEIIYSNLEELVEHQQCL